VKTSDGLRAQGDNAVELLVSAAGKRSMSPDALFGFTSICRSVEPILSYFPAFKFAVPQMSDFCRMK